MEFSRHVDVLGLIQRSVERTASAGRWLVFCVMIAPASFGSKVAFPKIEEFPSDRDARQVEKAENRHYLGVS